jgi:hypothetical protein
MPDNPLLKIIGFIVFCAFSYLLKEPVSALPLSTNIEVGIVVVSLLFGFFIIVVDTDDVTPGWKNFIIAGKTVFLPLSILSCALIFLVPWMGRGILLALLYVAFAWRVITRSGGIFTIVKRLMGSAE